MSSRTKPALPIQASFFHHVEFQCSHARLLATVLSNTLGMPLVSTLKTALGISYCLQSQQAMIICSAPATNKKNEDATEANSFHRGLKSTKNIHVRAIGFNVADPDEAYSHLSGALQHEGTESLQRHSSGAMDVSLPNALGQLSLRFLASDVYESPSFSSGIPRGMPGFIPCASAEVSEEVNAQTMAFAPGGITSIDHIAVNVKNVSQVSQRLRALTAWAPFRIFDEQAIHRPLSAITLSSESCEGLMTLVQPTNKNSIFEQALQANGGVYVHHIALRCEDILQLADFLSERGTWQSMPSPAASYYEKIRPIALDFLTPDAFDKLQRYGMLLDFEEDCALVQVFFPYLDDIPGVFFELISRVPRLNQAAHHIPAAGCGGFGDRNVAQLYDCLIRGVHQLPMSINLATKQEKQERQPVSIPTLPETHNPLPASATSNSEVCQPVES